MNLDEIETACEKFQIDLDDLEDRLLHVVINGDDTDLIDILMSGGPQCESCGSWVKTTEDDPDSQEIDGVWWKATGYTLISHWSITCNGCGARYTIERDEAKRDY